MLWNTVVENKNERFYTSYECEIEVSTGIVHDVSPTTTGW